MNYFFKVASGIELALLVLIGGTILFVPDSLPAWSPTIKGSGASAQEIANAISTPPSHLQIGLWQSLYHWQAFIAGWLAFFGAGLAVVAAVIGARELNLSTTRQINAEKEREEAKRNDLRLGMIYGLLEKALPLSGEINRCYDTILTSIDRYNYSFGYHDGISTEEMTDIRNESIENISNSTIAVPNAFNIKAKDFSVLGHQFASSVRNTARTIKWYQEMRRFIREEHSEGRRVSDEYLRSILAHLQDIFVRNARVVEAARSELERAGVRYYEPVQRPGTNSTAN